MAVPAFGKPWAGVHETRPRYFRTPLAWVPGAGDGALFIQHGEDPDNRRWVLLDEWDAWAKQAGAGPVASKPDTPPDTPPWDDEAGA